MALPKSTETPRLRYLHNLVDAANGEWADWPAVNKTDYTQIGKIIVLYSYIDVSIRRMVEAAENAGYLNEVWTGKVRKLKIGEAEEAVLSLPGWSEPNQTALKQIADRRGLRNLIAHFAVRRFSKDDAFLFFTKSDRDFKRAFGVDPKPGTIMTSVMECSQLTDGFRHIHALQLWIANAAAETEKMFVNLNPNV